MTKGRRTAALLLLATALGLAALGQYYFLRRRDYLWDGLVLHGLAVLSFALAWRLVTAGRRREKKPKGHALRLPALAWSQVVLTALMLGGFLSCGAAVLLSRTRAWNQTTLDAVVLWLLGIGMILAAAVWLLVYNGRPASDWRSGLQSAGQRTWLEVATVACLTLLAFVLRAAALAHVPYTLGGDEAWHGLLARQVLEGELRNPFVMGYMSMPTFFYWPLSWSLWLVGDSVTGLRLPAALAGAATIPILYLFARRLWGPRIAILSALFLAAYDYHIHYSRLGANNVWDPLFVLLTLWFLDIGLTSTEPARQMRFFTLSGLVMGLSIYFYTGARLLPLLVAAYVVFFWIKQQRSRDQSPPMGRIALLLVVFSLAFLTAAGPMLSYALSHPEEWSARVNQVGIIQSGWLAREPGLTGKSTLQILAEQFLRAAGAFHVFPDRTAWYGADRPLLSPVAGVFAILGMGWALVHWQQRRNFLILIWFWSVVITGGMLTESPPSSQRLVIAIPAMALLVAIGMERTAGLLRQLLAPRHKPWANILLAVLIVGLAVGAIHFYFIEFTPERRYGSVNGETATMMGHYLQDLGQGTQAYLFGAPRLYWSFGSMTFMAPGVDGEDIVDPLDSPPSFVDERRGAVFLFLPERRGELAWVQEAFPEGKARDIQDTRGQLRFTVYEVLP